MPRKCSSACPLQPYVHEDTLGTPKHGMLVHVGTGQIVAVRRGRISGLVYHRADGQGASCYRMDIADVSRGLVDPSLMASAWLLTHPDGRGRRSGEQMRWVCACTRPSPLSHSSWGGAE